MVKIRAIYILILFLIIFAINQCFAIPTDSSYSYTPGENLGIGYNPNLTPVTSKSSYVLGQGTIIGKNQGPSAQYWAVISDSSVTNVWYACGTNCSYFFTATKTNTTRCDSGYFPVVQYAIARGDPSNSNSSQGIKANICFGIKATGDYALCSDSLINQTSGADQYAAVNFIIMCQSCLGTCPTPLPIIFPKSVGLSGAPYNCAAPSECGPP